MEALHTKIRAALIAAAEPNEFGMTMLWIVLIFLGAFLIAGFMYWLLRPDRKKKSGERHTVYPAPPPDRTAVYTHSPLPPNTYTAPPLPPQTAIPPPTQPVALPHGKPPVPYLKKPEAQEPAAKTHRLAPAKNKKTAALPPPAQKTPKLENPPALKATRESPIRITVRNTEGEISTPGNGRVTESYPKYGGYGSAGSKKENRQPEKIQPEFVTPARPEPIETPKPPAEDWGPEPTEEELNAVETWDTPVSPDDDLI